MAQFAPRRAHFVVAALACLLAGMSARVAWLQSYGGARTIRWAERQQYAARPIQARRGNIYDAQGVLLAGTVQQTAVYIDPAFMLAQYQKPPRNLNQMDDDLRRLARVLEVDGEQLIAAVTERFESRYARIVGPQPAEVCKAVEQLKIPGVGFEPVFERAYPMGSLAAHIVGSCGTGGNGLEGLELRFQKQLAGNAGFRRIQKDAAQRPIGLAEDDYAEPIHGRHLVLTIDANIQMIAEQELADACQRFKAKRGEVVVLDPRTGEVLAMANYPTFNPQNVGDSPPEARRNAAIVMPYEPGSTIKPFIAGPAMALNVTRPEEVWRIPGASYNPYGSRVIRDVHGYGPLTTWDILVKSSNIGSCMIAERMGNSRLYTALAGFAFGRRTGIELPAEDPGLLNEPGRWTRYSTESVAQGYEVMVTPLQLARGMAVYANGGRLVPVSVVKGVLDPEGQIIARRPPVNLADCPQAVSEKAAADIRRILADVPVRGTAQGKGSRYWNIFGKTGTSHVSRGPAGYSSTLYNSSFIAGAPYEDPRIVIAMAIHEPDAGLGYYGGTVSAPPAVRIIERTLGYLRVSPSPSLPLPPAAVAQNLVNYRPSVYARRD